MTPKFWSKIEILIKHTYCRIVIPEDAILGIDFWLPVHDYVPDLAGDTLG